MKTTPSLTCGIGVNGHLYCWGFNAFGVCDPPRVDRAWIDVALGLDFACGITIDGQAHCWGGWDQGQLDIPQLKPGEVWKRLSAHHHTTCGTTSLARGLCWGGGVGRTYQDGPAYSEDAKWLALTVSDGFVCGVTVAHALICWKGHNGVVMDTSEQWGEQLAVDSAIVCGVSSSRQGKCLIIREADEEVSRMASVVASNTWALLDNFCGITMAKELLCWGVPEPTRPDMEGIGENGWSCISGNGDGESARRCAVDSDGSLACWGYDLGRLLDTPAGAYDTISVSDVYGCALQENSASCWGDILLGVTGDLLDSHFDVLKASRFHACGILNGFLSCNGGCFNGECEEPGKSQGIQWRLLAVSERRTCGVTTDDYLCCWGDFDPQEALGCNFDAPPAEFVQEWSKISLYFHQICGIAGNKLMCWWAGTLQIERNHTERWVDLSNSGAPYVCGVLASGELYCFFPVRFAVPHLRFLTISIGEGATCGVLFNRTAICQGWGTVFGEQGHGLLLPQVTWESLSVWKFHICGIEYESNSLRCWSPHKPPPERPSLDLDLRYAHAAGLQMSQHELCYYQYIVGVHRCIDITGATKSVQGNNAEAFLLFRDVRGTIFPANGNMVPSGSQVIFTPLSDRFARSYTVDVPYDCKALLVGSMKVAVLVLEPFPGALMYLSADPFNLPSDDMSPQPIPIPGPLLHATASESRLCVLNPAHLCWCVNLNDPGEGEYIDGITWMDTTKTHICAVTVGGGLACWGDGPLPFTEKGPPPFDEYVSVSTSFNLTCAITASSRIQCWGTPVRVDACEKVFGDTGWTEVVVEDHMACASHVNGRLVCPDTVNGSIAIRSPSAFASLHTIIGLAPSLSQSDTCLSSESCITSDFEGAPYHTGILVLEDVQVATPLKSQLQFFGHRTKIIRSTDTRSVVCHTPSGPDPCLAFAEAQGGLRIANVKVEASSVIHLMAVRNRPWVVMESTSWRVREVDILSSSITAVSNVDSVAIHRSTWSGSFDFTTYGEITVLAAAQRNDANSSKRYAGLFVTAARSVTLNDCTWSNLAFSGLSAPVVFQHAPETVSVAGCSFNDNAALHGSGGLAVIDERALTSLTPLSLYSVTNTNFKRNVGFRGGGLLWATATSWRESTRTCFGCASGNLATVSLRGATFENNSAWLEGGAVYVDGVSLHASFCNFSRNVAGRAGGSIAAANASLALHHTTVECSTVEPRPLPSTAQHTMWGAQPHKGGGGGIAVRRCNLPGLVLQQSKILSNAVNLNGTQDQGGGVRVEDCFVSMNQVSFKWNRVYVGGGGGLALLQVPEESKGINLTVEGNVAGARGGGLVAQKSTIAFQGIHCINNNVTTNTSVNRTPSPYDATGVGGCLSMTAESAVSVHSAVITGNRAMQGGGVHYDCSSAVRFTETEFTNNVGMYQGAHLLSECDSRWLSRANHSAQMNTLDGTWRMAVASGPVAVKSRFVAPAVFEGVPQPGDTLIAALVDVNGMTIFTDSITTCSVNVSIVEDSTIQPGLISPAVVQARSGLIELREFGFNARTRNTDLHIKIDLACNGLPLQAIMPIARIKPRWAVAPPQEWVPSSGSALLAVRPVPVVLLYLPFESLATSVQVKCTVRASLLQGNRTSETSVALLNLPPDGFVSEGEYVELPRLFISSEYHSHVRVVVECTRKHEALEPVWADFRMKPPVLHWKQRLPSIIHSGVPQRMAVSLHPHDSPALNASECSVEVASSWWATSSDLHSLPRIPPSAFVRGGTAIVRNGSAIWNDVIIEGVLGSWHEVRINCSTGEYKIPSTRAEIVQLGLCAAGSEPNEDLTSCSGCRGATYSPGQLEPCRGCPPGGGASCANGQLQLIPGYYPANTVYLTMTQPGEDGKTNSRGISRDEVPPMTSDTILYMCDTTVACIVVNNNTAFSCASGYTGPLCSACAEGYAKTGLFCTSCWPPWASALFLFVCVSGVSAALVYIAVVRSRKRDSSSSRLKIIARMTLSFLQMLSSLGQFRTKATETVQSLMGFADAASASVLSVAPVQCALGLGYYARFALTVSLPLIVGCLVVCIACVSILAQTWFQRHRRKMMAMHLGTQQPEPSSRNRTSTLVSMRASLRQYFKGKSFLGPVLFVYFFFYNSLSSSCAAVFRCREEIIDGAQYLEVAPTVRCFTATHVAAMVVAGAIAIAFNVFTPLLLIRILKKNSHKLHMPAMRKRYGFLYSGYSITRGLYWWEAVVLMRKFMVLAVASTIVDPFYQSLLGIATVVFFFLLQVHFRPYETKTMNGLEVMVFSCLTATQVVSLAYFRSESLLLSSQKQAMVDIIVTFALLAVNCGCLCVLGYFGWRMFRMDRRSKQEMKLARFQRHGRKLDSRPHSPSDRTSDVVANYPWQWCRGRKEMPRSLHSADCAQSTNKLTTHGAAPNDVRCARR